MSPMMSLALDVGLLLSPVAALMGFAISYSEYSRHYPGKRMPLLLSLRTALFVFAFFMLLSFAIGLVLPDLVGHT